MINYIFQVTYHLTCHSFDLNFSTKMYVLNEPDWKFMEILEWKKVIDQMCYSLLDATNFC